MKNFIFILIFVIAAVFVYMARPDNSLPVDRLIVFSQDQCPHCHDALAFIDKQIRPKYQNLKIDVLDIADRSNMNKLLSLISKRQMDKNTIGTPVIVLGDTTLVGWTAANEVKLLNAVRQFVGEVSPTMPDTLQASSQTGNDTGLCQPGDTEHCME